MNCDSYGLMHIPSDALACGETRPDGWQPQTGEEMQERIEAKQAI